MTNTLQEKLASFELHFTLNSRQQLKRKDGSYFYPEIRAMWEGYQAGMAAATLDADVKFDLVEALQELASEYRKALEELFEPQHHRFIETNTALKMARAAITKATEAPE